MCGFSGEMGKWCISTESSYLFWGNIRNLWLLISLDLMCVPPVLLVCAYGVAISSMFQATWPVVHMLPYVTDPYGVDQDG